MYGPNGSNSRTKKKEEDEEEKRATSKDQVKMCATKMKNMEKKVCVTKV